MTALGGIVNIFSEIKEYEEDILFTGKAVEQMKIAFGNMDVDDAIKAFRGLGVEGDDLVEILLDCGVKSEVIEASLKKVGKSGIPLVTKLKDGFKGLAGMLGMTASQLGVFMAALAIPAIVVASAKAYSERIQECVDNAKTAAAMWSEQNADLKTQVSTLEDFNKKLKDGNLTEEESYQIKSDLYSMQQNICESYGDLASDIDLVNGKLEEEIQKVKDLTAAWANEFVTENRVGGQKAVDEMVSQKDYKFTQFNHWKPGSGADVVDDILSHFSDMFDTYAADAEGVNFEIRFTGNPEEAKKAYGEVLQYIRDSGYDVDNMPALEAFRNGIESMYNQAKGTIDEYGDLADEFMEATLLADNKKYTIGADSKRASDWVDEYEASVEKYNKALKSGDQEAISNAAKEFSDAKTALETAIDENGNTVLSQYESQIKDITDALDAGAIKANDFKKALRGDDSVLGRSIDEYGKQLKSMGLDDIDLKAMLSNSNDAEFGEHQFRQLIDAAYDYGLIAGKTADDVQPLIDILIELGYVSGETASKTQDANKKIVSSYDDAVQSVSSLKSELGAINSAVSEQGYSGNLSVDTYNSLIAISKDYAECIEYQNGAIQLNAEKANMLFEAKSELKKAEIELQKISEATKWKENADEIARLTKEYDGLDEAIADKIKSLEKENDGIEANLVGYDLQIAAIEELTSAYGRWKAVSESDNSDSMYKDIQNAYKAIKEAQKTGQTGVGNVVYQAAVELLVPDGEDVKKYMSTLQRYITDGSNGLSNFINDMVSKGLMERSKSDWNKVSMVAGTTMQEIMDKMTLTPDMAKAIFNALEMYDFDFHWTDEDFNINTASVEEMQAELKRLQAEADATRAKIVELNDAGAKVDVSTGLSLEDYQKRHDEQIAAYNEVAKKLGTDTYDQAANKIEYTVTANTEEADSALDAIKDKLEEILKKIEDIFNKELGDLGGGYTLSILKSVLNTLRNINAYKIADKSFNVYENVISSSTGGGSTTHISSSGKVHGGGGGSFASAEANGTRHAKAGVALVGDEYSPDGSPKPELIITDGAAYVAGQNGPEFVSLKDGDQVVPASETEQILQRNPDIKQNIVPAFATGAGGWPAGSVSEDKYLEGVIGPTQEWLNQQKEAQKKKDDELIKQLSAKAAEKSADDTYLNTIAKENYYVGTTTKHIDGDGDQSSLRNYGSGGSGGSGSSDSSSTTKEKSAFEKEYDSRNHLLAMERADYQDYIDWLEGAYKDAYNKGEIELEDFYRYEQEVFEGRKELFQDSIGDIEHKIKALERDPGNETQIINYYNQIISKIDTELAAARARGLNDDDDYVQELLEQKWDYADEIKDIQDEITENAKDAVEDLIDYRMDMLKQDLENERDAIGDKLDTLRDFYDKQKEMLQDVYDEEKYLEEQSEKRKSVDDIKAEMEELKFNDSAAAQKRLDELREELLKAEKELSDFEKDHALENATDLLDKMYEQQESQMQSEMDALEEKLNDPNALYNQALRDIQNNTLALYEEMVAYNNKYGSGNPEDIYTMWDEADKSLDAYFKTMGESYKNILLVDAYKPTGYASGTSHATPGIHELFEGNKDEYVYTTKDGKRYRMFSGLGDKVLNASATDFLYKFANNGETFISNMLNGLVSAIGNVGKPAQQIQLSTGDIIVQGNASADTVSAIRRAQRENVDYILREFQRLNR
jgi:DNA repair exonuclease SbcCD ATPase subunit